MVERSEERRFVDIYFFKCRKAFCILFISASGERRSVDTYFSSGEKRSLDLYLFKSEWIFQVRVVAKWCHVKKSAE